jgi:sulfite reductase (NADPH) flavoprotein alpha-component
MSQNLPPPYPVLVPESAPFSAEQRAWLNGFFAGLVSLDGAGVTALSAEQSAALMPAGAPVNAFGDRDDGEAPWHDQTLPLAERMTLAEGRPLRRRMMAAMAQQDCGQCGYNCQDYSNALFLQKETRLNLCVPGGKETARMLKSLYEELGNAPPAAKAPASAAESAPAPALFAAERGRSRDNPVTAIFESRRLLNRHGSNKETWHLEIDLRDSGLDYAVGDAFGLFPANDPALVDCVLKALDAPPDFPIAGRALRDVLLDGVSLSPAPDMLFQLFSYITGGERRQKAKALASGEDPDGDAATLDVLAAIEKFSGVRPDPEAFVEALDPLQPRLYSISSSPKVNVGRVALTVDAVRYRIGARTRLGVASTFLAERIAPGDAIKTYVQKAHAFGLPADRRAGPQLAVLRPPAQRLRLLLQGRVQRDEGSGLAHAPVARLVARRQRENLRAGPHARSRPRPVGVACRGRARLRLRRRQAHGQGCRARTCGRGRQARRPLGRRGGGVRGGAEEDGPLPAGCVLR